MRIQRVKIDLSKIFIFTPLILWLCASGRVSWWILVLFAAFSLEIPIEWERQ